MQRHSIDGVSIPSIVLQSVSWKKVDTTLYVFNLAHHLNDNDLRKAYAHFGKILRCHFVYKEPPNMCICFIDYQNILQAIKASATTNATKLFGGNTIYARLNGRTKNKRNFQLQEEEGYTQNSENERAIVNRSDPLQTTKKRGRRDEGQNRQNGQKGRKILKLKPVFVPPRQKMNSSSQGDLKY